MQSKAAKIIRYLVSRHDGRLGRTALVKLLYLLDLDARRYLGHQVTDFAWRRYKNGPFPAGSRFYDEIDELLSADQVREKMGFVDDANVMYRYHTVEGARPDLEGLTPGERMMVEAIDRRYGSVGMRGLLRAAYATAPMKATPKHGPLPVELVNDKRPVATQGVDFEELAEALDRCERGEFVPASRVDRVLRSRLRPEG